MSMLSILTEPNPRLHQKCEKVRVFDDKLKQFADSLVEIMFKNKGIGMASPQLGKTIRFIAIEFNPERFEETSDKKLKTKDGKVEKNQKTIPLTMICNPKIISCSKEQNIMDEGCLSLPGIEIPIKRANTVKVLGQDIKGNRLKVKAKGLFARILQHEIDHLDGILITDRVKNVRKKNKVKIVFIGTPDFAVPILEKLITVNYKLIAVVTEPDRPKGRGRVLTPPPIKVLANKHNITVLQPKKILAISDQLSAISPDLIIVCAYGQIIPQKILDIPKFGTLNIHPSLLPKYRGATPIQAAILNGDTETGVTIMKMDALMDHGDIVKKLKLKIKNENYQELNEKLSEFGAKLLIDILPQYLPGKIKLTPQNHQKATYTKLIKKADGLIDWKRGAIKIDQQIRAYYPWPGTYFIAYGKRFIIKQAHLEKNQLVIDQIQPENKPVMDFREFKLGYPKILTKLPIFVKI